LERLIRLLRIIQLIQSHPGVKAKELAAVCETTERTIYRDLELLSAANIPISNEGRGKGYKFIGYFKQYPMNWDEDEYNSFRLLPALLAEQYQTKAFRSAYEKVMATHAAEKIERKKVISDFSRVIQNGKLHSEMKDHTILSKITEAVLSMHTIEAVYHTQSRNATTKRKLDPYFLIPRNNRLYVIGYCHKNKDIRTFRLNRFLDVEILAESFMRDNINLEKYLQYTWSVIRGDKKINFKVKFSKNIARYIKEEEFNVKPTLTDLPDGSLLFDVTLNDDLEFIQWIMKYGPDAEILEPKEYRKRLKEKLRQWVEIYEVKI